MSLDRRKNPGERETRWVKQQLPRIAGKNKQYQRKDLRLMKNRINRNFKEYVIAWEKTHNTLFSEQTGYDHKYDSRFQILFV